MNDLRDEFAARAPTEVPSWYRPEPAPLPRSLDYLSALALVTGFCELSPAKQDDLVIWMRDPIYDLDDNLQAIGDAAFALVVERNEAIDSGLRDAEAARYVGWRYHYADLMLRERDADQARREQSFRNRRSGDAPRSDG